MRSKWRETGALLLVGCALALPLAAEPLGASFDVSSLSGSDFLVSLNTFNENGVAGDSYVILDNVRLQVGPTVVEPPGLLDFEDGTLQGFDASLNVGSVENVPGGWRGARAMRMGENLILGLVIADRTFPMASAAVLALEFEFFGSSTPGLGFDAFVVELLDPITFAPLVPGLTGAGDVLEVSARGIFKAPGTTVVPLNELPVAARATTWGRIKSLFAE